MKTSLLWFALFVAAVVTFAVPLARHWCETNININANGSSSFTPRVIKNVRPRYDPKTGYFIEERETEPTFSDEVRP
jgi:hypothetical protein